MADNPKGSGQRTVPARRRKAAADPFQRMATARDSVEDQAPPGPTLTPRPSGQITGGVASVTGVPSADAQPAPSATAAPAVPSLSSLGPAAEFHPAKTLTEHFAAIRASVSRGKSDRNTNTNVPSAAAKKAKKEARDKNTVHFVILLDGLANLLKNGADEVSQLLATYRAANQVSTPLFGNYQPSKRSRGDLTRFTYTPTEGFEDALDDLVEWLRQETGYGAWSKALLVSLTLVHRYRLDPSII